MSVAIHLERAQEFFLFQYDFVLYALGASVLVGVVCGLIGVVGGATVRRNPVSAGVLMAVAGVGGFLAVSLFWVLPGGMLLIGSWMAWVVKQRHEETPTR